MSERRPKVPDLLPLYIWPLIYIVAFVGSCAVLNARDPVLPPPGMYAGGLGTLFHTLVYAGEAAIAATVVSTLCAVALYLVRVRMTRKRTPK
jgi:hypothetical protein